MNLALVLAACGDSSDGPGYTSLSASATMTEADETGASGTDTMASASTTDASTTDASTTDGTDTDTDDSTSTTTDTTDGPLLDVGGMTDGTTMGGDGTGGELGCEKVDLLFVVDDSASMSDNQDKLTAAFPSFMQTVDAELVIEEAACALSGETVAVLWRNPDGDEIKSLRWGLLRGGDVVATGVLPLSAESVVAESVLATPEGFLLLLLNQRPDGVVLVCVPLGADGTVGASRTLNLRYPPAVAPMYDLVDGVLVSWGITARTPTLVVQREVGEPLWCNARDSAAGFYARAGWTEKGWDFYLSNHWFHGKVTLFILIGLLSLYPTKVLLGWRKTVKAGHVPEIDATLQRNLRGVLVAELHLVVLMPILAALMARGVGMGV